MPIVEIADLSDARLRPYSGMTDGQLRRGEGFRRDNPEGLFIGESARVIERALEADLRPLSLLVEQRWVVHDEPLVRRVLELWPDTPVFKASVEQFKELTGYEVVRGALATFVRPPLPDAASLLDGAHRVAILESVTNYANMGAIFRSAAALGIDAVLVSPSCHDPYYRRCARVSMGAVFQVPWTRIEGEREWAPDFMPVLKRAGFTTAALALRDDSIAIDNGFLAQTGKLAVVLGTEGEGLAQSTIDACDFTVRIPMDHGVDSLNVAAASAIAFWEMRKLFS